MIMHQSYFPWKKKTFLHVKNTYFGSKLWDSKPSGKSYKHSLTWGEPYDTEAQST